MRASGGGPGAGRPRVEHCTDEHRQREHWSSPHLSSRRAASARPPAFPCPSCRSASRRGCRGLTSRRTYHAVDEGLDLGRGLLTVIDQVGTLRRFARDRILLVATIIWSP